MTTTREIDTFSRKRFIVWDIRACVLWDTYYSYDDEDYSDCKWACARSRSRPVFQMHVCDLRMCDECCVCVCMADGYIS